MKILNVTIIFRPLHFSRKACTSEASAVGTQKPVIELIDSDLWKSDAGPNKTNYKQRHVY